MVNIDTLFEDFALAHEDPSGPNGYLLATCISPEPPKHDQGRLYHFRNGINAANVSTDLRFKLQCIPSLRLDKDETKTWVEIFTAYHKFVGSLLAAEELQNVGKTNAADWAQVYDEWKKVVNTMYQGYHHQVLAAWTIPCLYVGVKYLRVFAIKADKKSAAQRESGMAFGGIQEEDAFDPDSVNEKLEDAARQINRIFGLCLGDRNSLEDSRKWALYYIATALFKTHFKLNHISLSKNILRSLKSQGDMPPLSQFPKSHQVAFMYYCGVIHFVDEDYAAAEEYLTSAYTLCHAKATKNIQLILTYLIPTKLLTSHTLPSSAVLAQYPGLARLFQPIAESIRKGDLAAFNAALESGEEEFVKRRIYLTLERGRDVILRNIFRKVFLAGGFEPPKEGETTSSARRTRVSTDEFAAALQMAGAEVNNGDQGFDYDEVECLIANAIYKNLMKGYIARERRMVVLNKNGAFPGTGV
ncbi:putative proteasome component (PCI) domain, winged helix-like DNA-binding domain superfamily [Septoria linicola]|nr:putative proteasome component (PCI) domain, winged helix-like DNA-binding domain superfamily [Septoria linicola]